MCHPNLLYMKYEIAVFFSTIIYTMMEGADWKKELVCLIGC